jgi:hypothetical protein
MRQIFEIARLASSNRVPRRSFKVALVVGTVLTAINQGDRLLASEGVDFTKVLLTYLVPYCVATYGAVTARMDSR